MILKMSSTENNILVKAIARLEEEYERLSLPRARVLKLGLQPGWNAVIGSDGCCGVAMSFRRNNPNYGDAETFFEVNELKRYVGTSLFDMARDCLRDGSVRHRSMAVAAMNALSQPLVADDVLRAKGYATGVDMARLVHEDDIVAIVGYGGLVREYTGRCKELHVTDMRPVSAFGTAIIGETVTYGPVGIRVHPAEDNPEVLARADVVFITGSTLVNDTFEEVAGYASNARLCCLYGSSAQLLPDVLFENGIDVVMSVAITDTGRFEQDVMNSSDMEGSLKKGQRKYTVGKSPGVARD